MSPRLTFRSAVLMAGILALGLSACGRRGSLEPPPDPSAPQAQQGTASEGSGQGTLPSSVGTPRAKSSRGHTISDKPFILDPLL